MKYIYTILYYAFKWSGIFKFFNHVMIIRNQHVVLCYHRIQSNNLEAHLSFLTENFEPVNLKTFLERIYPIDTAIAKNKSIMIAFTMDDCYSNDFHNAVTMFSKYKVHCTFFVPTFYSKHKKSMWPMRLIQFFESINAPATILDFNKELVMLKNRKAINSYSNLMIQELQNGNRQTLEIEEMVDDFFLRNNHADISDAVIGRETMKIHNGNKYVSFQSHTVTHPKLNMSNRGEIMTEFNESKNYLKSVLPYEDQYIICYPYGSRYHIGESYKFSEANFKYGVTLEKGIVSKRNNKYLIPRIALFDHDTPQRIKLKILLCQIKSTF